MPGVIIADNKGKDVTTTNPFPVEIMGSHIPIGAPIYVSLATALSSEVDSVDVGKMTQGTVTTALNAVTATTASDEIPLGAAGFKSLAIEFTGAAFTSGNFANTITGAAISGGTFGNIYRKKDDGTDVQVTLPTINANATTLYIIENLGVPYIKITGTRTTDGTLTVKVVPFN